jgi:hypothetical protein
VGAACSSVKAIHAVARGDWRGAIGHATGIVPGAKLLQAGAASAKGLAFAAHAAAAAGKPKKPVTAWEVGRANDLKNRSVAGDRLAIHHAPQGKVAGQNIKRYHYPTGPAIAVPEHLHGNIKTVKGKITISPRDQLARDLHELRRVGAPNDSLKKLVTLNRTMFKSAYRKR